MLRRSLRRTAQYAWTFLSSLGVNDLLGIRLEQIEGFAVQWFKGEGRIGLNGNE